MTVRYATAIVLMSTMFAWGTVRAEEKPSERTVPLSSAAVNTWIRISQTPTGWREQSIFVYAAGVQRFIMASGYQTYGGVVPRHYDTEEFDLAAVKWFNAYPAGAAGRRPESGPVGEEYSQQRAGQGHNGFELFYKDGDHLRLGAGGQWLETRGYYQYCYVPDNGKVYASLHDKTLCYDPVQRTWEDLKAEPRTSCRVWGAMCYDPVNREIVHAGGDGGSAEIGTWVFSIEKNQWQRLAFGSRQVQNLSEQAKTLRWQGKALLGAACNRFAITETDDEARADLKAQADELAAAAKRLAAAIQAAGLRGAEQAGGEMAFTRLTSAIMAVQAVAPKLGGRLAPEILAEVRAARVRLEQVVAALASEPTGRARSQIAYAPEHKKIVLFGGDELDRVLSDTWLYDCTTRTWEQKFPATCPQPRAGHALVWLPKAKQIVLAGGYSRDWLAQELWTYDLAANVWQLLLHVPLVSEDYGRQKFSPNCPRVTDRGTQVAAVNEDDVLVCLGNGNPGLITWACKVDARQPIEIADGQSAVSGDYTFHRIDPASWEEAADPEPAKMKKFYDELPVNQWTALKVPKYAPGAANRWGTTAYDGDRHQLLFWGGGHATSKENDVAHFSVRGNCWTIGYHPDDPIETVYAEQPTPVSFNDRAHVPIHAYKAYCYDPSAHKMFYFGRAYDPAVREWEPGIYPGLDHRGPMHSHMEPTPAGAVTFSDQGLFRFDAKARRWIKLVWNGPSPGGIWCDGHGLCYDSKRDCLWLANDKEIYRYDLATGQAEKTTPVKPKALGQFLFWGEEVYLPDADLVLLMNVFPKPDGTLTNIAWAPQDGQFYWVDLKFVEDGKVVRFAAPPFSWSDAMQCDPTIRLVLLNNSSAHKVWVLKFDRTAAKLTACR